MPSSIPVASYPAATRPYECVSDAYPPPHSRKKDVVLRLEPASVDQSSRAICHDGNPKWPYSPILFRQTHSPHGSLFNKDDEGTAQASLEDHRPAPPSSNIPTTKASIATLGLSLRSPAPKLDFLSVTALDPGRGYWDQHLPPRSSSLPSATRRNCRDMSKSGSSTPTLVGDDQCSAFMTFAAADPDESRSGSSTNVPSLQRSASLSSVSRGGRSDKPQPLALTHRAAAAAHKEQQSYHTLYAVDSLSNFPFAKLSGGTGFGVPILPPSPVSKPKPKITVDTRSTSADSKSSLLSLKRVKKLGHRSSISSLNTASPVDSRTSNPSASTSSLLSSDSRSTGTPELDTIFDPAETAESEEGTTMHVLVGTEWRRQDLSEVLPTLRSLRFSGRSGL